MTESERLKILEELGLLKMLFQIHQEEKIIQNEKEREAHLLAIIDQIQELEKILKDDLDQLN